MTPISVSIIHCIQFLATNKIQLFLTTLLPVLTLSSPIARRAIDQVFEGLPYNSTGLCSLDSTINGTNTYNSTSLCSWNSTTNSTNTYNSTSLCPWNSTANGTDTYITYSGDGSLAQGWPSISQWASFDYLWSANQALIANSCANIGAVGANNSPSETATVGEMIQVVANDTNVDSRFILAVMMQESKGCVRVQTTFGSNCNPGLMQDHCGVNSCVGMDPCPASEIYGMLQDGVGGTEAGDGLAGIMNEWSNGTATNENTFGDSTSLTQLYYRAARMYNSGSIDASGVLESGGSTHCYASDIANRLMGWVSASSTCPYDIY